MIRTEIMAKLRKEQIELIALMSRWEGTKKLYEGACVMGANDAADVFRQQLHDILDRQLDLTATSTALSKLYAEAPE